MTLRDQDNLSEVVDNRPYQFRVAHQECSLNSDRTSYDIAASIDLDGLDRELKEILFRRVDELELTVRTLNVFRSYNCQYVGDIVGLTDTQLLRMQNFGRKSFIEVHELLEALGLRNGLSIAGWNHEIAEEFRKELEVETPKQDSEVDPRIDLDSADRHLKIALVRRVDELGLSVRTLNCLKNKNCEYVGDVICLTNGQLMRTQNFGRKSLKELLEKLEHLGLQTGVSVRGWSCEFAKELRNELEDEVRDGISVELFAVEYLPPCVSKKQTLEDELMAIAKVVASDRNVKIITSYWGWSGSDRRTLEAVGQEHGITRERVRQIAAKAEKKLTNLPLPCPKLKEALAYLVEQAPAYEDMLAEGLASTGITASPFKVSGIISASKILNVDCPIVQTKVENSLIVIPKDSGFVGTIWRFIRLVRKLSRPQGYVNFDDLLDQLEIERDQERQSLSEFVNQHADFRWLDQDKKWLWDVTSYESGRNRVVNFLRKIFSVTSSIHISELRQGIGRHHRIGVAPPSQILLEICRQLDFLEVNGNRVETISGETLPRSLVGLESVLIEAFRGEPMLGRASLEANALALGINRSYFYILINYSPVVTRLAKGVYAQIGAEIPPGAVEATKTTVKKKKRIVDSGWKSGRHLWIAYHLSEMMLHETFISVPAALKEFLQGEWLMEPSGQVIPRFVSINDTRASGVQRLLKRRGAEPGDTLILVFDTKDHLFRIELGSDELVERWQNSELELTDDQLLELDPDDDA